MKFWNILAEISIYSMEILIKNKVQKYQSNRKFRMKGVCVNIFFAQEYPSKYSRWSINFIRIDVLPNKTEETRGITNPLPVMSIGSGGGIEGA